MGGIDPFREQLRELLSGVLAAAQVDELKALLREIAATEFVSELVSTVESDARRGYGRVSLFREGRAELGLVVLRPGERIRPHDHGVYECDASSEARIVGLVLVVQGSELNRFYRVTGTDTLEELSARSVVAGEVIELSPEIIHSVENVGDAVVAALHAYIHAQDDPATGKRRF